MKKNDFSDKKYFYYMPYPVDFLKKKIIVNVPGLRAPYMYIYILNMISI